MTMIGNDRGALLARLLAVQLVMFGAVAADAAWAEEATPNAGATLPSRGAGDAAAESGASTKGSDKTATDPQGGDKAGDKAANKAGGATEGASQRHVTTKDGAGGAQEPDGKAVRHGDDRTGAKHDGAAADPIDTRITVLGKPRSGRPWAVHDRNDHRKTKIVRPAGTADDRRRTLMPANKSNVVRNAIGQKVSRSAAARNGPDKKGVAAPLDGQPKSAGLGQSGGAVTAARGFVPAAGANSALHALPPNAAINRLGINGAAMVRPGVRPGAVGGATRTAAGVINGTDFRPRHP
jgi:hypothetical protein